MLRRKKSDKSKGVGSKSKMETKVSAAEAEKEGDGEEEEDRWVFDSLVGFLTGPIWNMPLLDFMESKCFEFESSEGKQDQYATLHHEYKHLVDVMLNSFMQDMGISADQFEKACVNARTDQNNGLAHIKQTLLQQICAAEDYDVFVHMMMKKNNELQLQTLHYLQHFGQSTDTSSDENDKELQDVIRRSLEEHEELIAQLSREKEEIDDIIASTLDDERRRLEEENKLESEMLSKAMKLSLDQSEYNDNEDTSLEDNAEKYRGPSPSPSVTACSSPLTPDAPLATTVDSPLQPASTAQSLLPAANKSEEGVSELDIASRRDYLRQQRDKIVAMKRSVRKLRMDDLDVSSSASQRPKSAKSARNALESNTDVSAGNLTPDILAARQALARRLKTEVVAQHQTSN